MGRRRSTGSIPLNSSSASGPKKKEPGLLRPLPEPPEATPTGRGIELGDDGFEVEVGVDLIRQGYPIEVDRQALLSAELPQHPAGRAVNELGALRRAGRLELLDDDPECSVQVREADLDVGVRNGAELVELGPATRDTTEACVLQRRVERVFIAFAPIDRLDVLIHPGEDHVGEIHARLGWLRGLPY